MGSRHHPDPLKPSRRARSVEARRARQATRSAISHAVDVEEILDPRPPHSLKVHHSDDAGFDDTDSPQRRAVKHWKLPFWKRRNQARHERNQAIEHLRRDD